MRPGADHPPCCKAGPGCRRVTTWRFGSRRICRLSMVIRLDWRPSSGILLKTRLSMQVTRRIFASRQLDNTTTSSFAFLTTAPASRPRNVERVCDSFYRVDNSLTRAASGAGLGLAICQGLVRAHGGSIWVEPRVAGACVAFSIPLHSKPARNAQGAEEGQARP